MRKRHNLKYSWRKERRKVYYGSKLLVSICFDLCITFLLIYEHISLFCILVHRWFIARYCLSCAWVFRNLWHGRFLGEQVSQQLTTLIWCTPHYLIEWRCDVSHKSIFYDFVEMLHLLLLWDMTCNLRSDSSNDWFFGKEEVDLK